MITWVVRKVYQSTEEDLIDWRHRRFPQTTLFPWKTDQDEENDGCEPEKDDGQGEDERGEGESPQSSSSRLAKICRLHFKFHKIYDDDFPTQLKYHGIVEDENEWNLLRTGRGEEDPLLGLCTSGNGDLGLWCQPLAFVHPRFFVIHHSSNTLTLWGSQGLSAESRYKKVKAWRALDF